MAKSTPAIHNNILFSYGEGQVSSIVVGSAQWFEWLDLETSMIFAFHSLDGSFTARKERIGNQRGGWYWKAYRKYQGTLYRAYLGKPEDLTSTRLNEIALSLANRVGGETKLAPPVAEIGSRSHSARFDETAVTPLLETKLHPPQLSARLVERPRLLHRLDSSFAHKLTLLLAPVGFGKTTLVNHWLARRSPSAAFPAVAWVSLDAGDNDPLRFWRYVVTACQTLLGQEQKEAGQAVALLTATLNPPFELPSIESALTHLLNSLAEPFSGGLLVLDDYHEITEPRIHETLAFFIDHLPKAAHVLVLSRSEPPLPLLRWRARGELCEIHVADLRFSSEETADFLQHALPITLSEAALSQLDTSLEGWVAGLHLLCLSLSGWRTSQAIEQALLSLGERASLSSPQRSLLDFFATEILERQPEPMQRFLLQTSVLTRLSGPLCDAVTGSANSATQLAAIERAGLFLEPLEGPGEWYRYHALFTEAMRREASHRMGEQALRDFSRRASLWYEQEGLLTEAIEAAWLSKDLERVAQLIEQLDLQNFYEPQTVMHWLERLPEAVLCAHPMLCLVYAIELRFPVELRFSQAASKDFELAPLSEAQRLRIESLLQMAGEGWLSAGMRPWLGAIWAFRVLSGLVGLEPFATLVDYARQALVYFPQEEKVDYRLQMWRSTCLLFIGIEDLRLGRIAEARQLLLQAVEDNVPPGNLYLASEIQAMLAKCYLVQGELQQAKKCFRQVMPVARKLADTEMMADILLELAWLSFEWNDLKGAEQQAREALELAHQLHPLRPELHDRAALQFALLQHVQGETRAALQQLNSLLSGPLSDWTPNSLGLFYRVRDWQGRLRIATGDWQAVQASLDTCDLDQENISLSERLGVQILQGRLLLAKGDARAALQQFSHLLPLAQEQLHQYAALEIQLLLALAHAACQQAQPAHYWLRQTLLQTASEGHIRLFLNEGKPMLALLRSLLKTLQHDTTLRSYVHMILSAASPGAGTARVAAPDSANLPPWSLTNQEQRVLRLLADGKSNQDIAQEMIVSVNTVKYHVKHLYEKLGVSNRQQASEAARYLKFSDLN